MPRYLKQDGKRVSDVTYVKSWIVIHTDSNKETIPINTETYLVPSRVADYIELLENSINGDTPYLPNNE